MPASPRADLDHAASALGGARRYLADGRAPVPLRFKVPWDARRAGPLEHWQTLRLTPPDLETYFAGGVTGVGNILGPASAGLTDVDLDCAEALAAADTFLLATECIFGRPSKPESHRVYVTDDALDTVRFKDVDAARTTLLELRSGGAQTVFPPSLHESGELVTFATDGPPARVAGAELRTAVASLAATTLLARHWPRQSGSRHDLALAVAGYLLRGGLEEDHAARIIETAARVADDPEARDRAAAVRTTAKRLAAGGKATGRRQLVALLGDRGAAVKEKLSEWLGLRADGPPWPTDEDAPGHARQRTYERPTAPPQRDRGILLAEVVREEVEWLWYPRLPLRKLALLVGLPDEGKSTLALELAARTSTGTPMPRETAGRPPAGVVILSAEDGLGDTIRPRLEAAGADLTRIVSLPFAELPSLDRAGLALLRALVARVEAALLVLDPLAAFLPDKVDSHNDHSVRRVLKELAALADETGACVLVIRHPTKHAVGGNPKMAGAGALGFTAAARAELLAASDPADPERKILARVKGNLGPPYASLTYRLVVRDDVVGIEWGDVTTITATDLLAEPEADAEQSARESAANFLREALGGGSQWARELYRDAARAGVAKRTLWRAKDRLKVRAKQASTGRWFWYLWDHGGDAPVEPPRARAREDETWQPDNEVASSGVGANPANIPNSDESHCHVANSGPPRARAREEERELAVREAVAVWQSLLANGPVSAERAEHERRTLGIGERAWRTARHRLHVETAKESFTGGWSWRLPPPAPPSPPPAPRCPRCASPDGEAGPGVWACRSCGPVAVLERAPGDDDPVLDLAEALTWPCVPLGPGLTIGATEDDWRTFCATAPPADRADARAYLEELFRRTTRPTTTKEE